MIGRRQALYLEEMLRLFERGDLDAALRRAIPIEGAGGGDAAPALGVPKPRAELSIGLETRRAHSVLGLPETLVELLRRRYRAAFEALDARGRTKDAAFVLAELLRSSEEAVAYLERKGELRLAAEVAEARALPAGLVVRQWFLAGDVPRAIALARLHGAFADAVGRLGKAPEADALRLLWADALASAGAFAAAVDVVWAMPPSRRLVAEWIDRAIAVGGPTGARMLARKLAVDPSVTSDVNERVVAFLDDDARVFAFAKELVSLPRARPRAPVARTLVRALLGRPSSEVDPALVEDLLAASEDPLLRADVEGARSRRIDPGRFVLTAWTTSGLRDRNHDACFVADGGSKLRSCTTTLDLAAPLKAPALVLAVYDLADVREPAQTARDATEAIVRRFLPVVQVGRDRGTLAGALARAIDATSIAAHRRLSDASRSRGFCGGFLAIVGADLIHAHAGSVRLQLHRSGRLHFESRDHVLEIEAATVVTRSLGASVNRVAEADAMQLARGDRIAVFTDGLTKALDGAELASILSGAPSPAAARLAIERRLREHGPIDNATIAILDVAGDAFPEHVDAAATSPTVGAPPHDLVLEYDVADCGATAILDAALLPNGDLLLALGERGLRIVDLAGRTRIAHDLPAEKIVLSTHGDRALVLARRGPVTAIARVDLLGGRAERWCEAAIGAAAATCDGDRWYVAIGSTVHAIDLLAEDFRSVWSTPADAPIVALSWSGAFLQAACGDELWTWQVDSRILRGRSPLAGLHVPGSFGGREFHLTFELMDDGWFLPRFGEDGVSRRPEAAFEGEPLCVANGPDFHAWAFATSVRAVVEIKGEAPVTITLEGARSVSLRAFGFDLVVADDRGRVLVVDTIHGRVRRDLRVH
jgi:serine/threonine protein phosphatase PrpC